MNPWKIVVSTALLANFAGCAARPAYFGSGARVVQENGAAYWEAAALTPAYLQVRMRRPRRAVAGAPDVYEGTISLRSIDAIVLRSSFTLAEGSSATFHYEFNSRPAAAVRYDPGALDVVVACARGACRAAAKHAPIAEDGTIALKKRRRLRPEKRAAATTADSGALAAGAALRKDGECATLDDALKAARTRIAQAGGGETREEQTARNRFIGQGCAVWLDEHGGAGAARRRLRLSQWTSLRGD
jgi:hypothetical protein